MQISEVSGSIVPAPPSPAPAPSPASCPQPHLGNLCGQDAIGAIVGIILGGLAVLGILAAMVYYVFFMVGQENGFVAGWRLLSN